MASHGKFKWVRPEVYPLLAAVGVGVVAMVVALQHSIFSVGILAHWDRLCLRHLRLILAGHRMVAPRKAVLGIGVLIGL